MELGKMVFSVFKKNAGSMVTQGRELPPFNGISNTGVFDIKVFCGKKQAVEITAGEEIIENIKTVVTNNILDITAENLNAFKDCKVTVNIEVPDINILKVFGVCQLEMYDVKNERLDLDVGGAASINIFGRTIISHLDVSGAAAINMLDLEAEKVEIDASGAASIKVFASGELDINISGVSSVRYAGNPASIRKKVSGLASVREI
jgi:hypothetical protein